MRKKGLCTVAPNVMTDITDKDKLMKKKKITIMQVTRLTKPLILALCRAIFIAEL
ncbi:MAG: hypothetical protein ACJATW_000437 [Glaciecola sp.]